MHSAAMSCHPRRITQTRAFDTEAAGSASATGFVVDKHRGLILTNRHVVTPGPIVAGKALTEPLGMSAVAHGWPRRRARAFAWRPIIRPPRPLSTV